MYDPILLIKAGISLNLKSFAYLCKDLYLDTPRHNYFESSCFLIAILIF